MTQSCVNANVMLPIGPITAVAVSISATCSNISCEMKIAIGASLVLTSWGFLCNLSYCTTRIYQIGDYLLLLGVKIRECLRLSLRRGAVHHEIRQWFKKYNKQQMPKRKVCDGKIQRETRDWPVIGFNTQIHSLQYDCHSYNKTDFKGKCHAVCVSLNIRLQHLVFPAVFLFIITEKEHGGIIILLL